LFNTPFDYYNKTTPSTICKNLIKSSNFMKNKENVFSMMYLNGKNKNISLLQQSSPPLSLLPTHPLSVASSFSSIPFPLSHLSSPPSILSNVPSFPCLSHVLANCCLILWEVGGAGRGGRGL
jgi:hypothetical protein